MDVQQLRARVAQLESAIDRTKVESAQATQQLRVPKYMAPRQSALTESWVWPRGR